MKRRKARDMLAKRTRRGREEEFFTAKIVRWVGLKLVFFMERSLHFWVNASGSLKTSSNSSAMSKISFRRKWEKSNVHLVLPNTMRRTSFQLATGHVTELTSFKLTWIMRFSLPPFIILEEICK